jgi:hypothetical protein
VGGAERGGRCAATFFMSFLRHGKSIDPISGRENAGAGVAPAPALIGLDEFRLAIPRQVGLHQSPPPLHQPGAVCCKLGLLVESFAANGKLSLNCLSHPRGQAQMVSEPLHETTPGRPATAIRIPVVLCGAPGVRTKTLSTKKKGPGCKPPSRPHGERVGEVFLLDILSHRMSVIAWFRQPR